jgi:hypothetical protein
LKSINGLAALLWQSNRRDASETGVAPQARRSGISVSVRYGKSLEAGFLGRNLHGIKMDRAEDHAHMLEGLRRAGW